MRVATSNLNFVHFKEDSINSSVLSGQHKVSITLFSLRKTKTRKITHEILVAKKKKMNLCQHFFDKHIPYHKNRR